MLQEFIQASAKVFKEIALLTSLKKSLRVFIGLGSRGTSHKWFTVIILDFLWQVICSENLVLCKFSICMRNHSWCLCTQIISFALQRTLTKISAPVFQDYSKFIIRNCLREATITWAVTYCTPESAVLRFTGVTITMEVWQRVHSLQANMDQHF